MGSRAQLNLFDLLVGQFSSEHSLPSDFDRVVVVSDARAPLEVINPVIGFHAVDVVDLWKVSRIGDESKRNEAVHCRIFTNAVSGPQKNVGVSLSVGRNPHYSTNVVSRSVSRAPSAADAIKASNPTETADLIEISEDFEVHPFPFLNAWGIHQAATSLEKLASVNLVTWHQAPVNLNLTRC